MAVFTEQASFYKHSASKQKGCVSLGEFTSGNSRGGKAGSGSWDKSQEYSFGTSISCLIVAECLGSISIVM